MKPHSQAPTTRATRTRKFLLLFGAAWVFAGALMKWDAPWLYVLLGFTVFAALWVGRQQQPAILRVLLLLALVFPAWKIVDHWRTRAAVHGNVAVIGDDAAVIRTLVTAEETDLRLSPKMSALSKGLLNLRLPGPGTEIGVRAFSHRVRCWSRAGHDSDWCRDGGGTDVAGGKGHEGGHQRRPVAALAGRRLLVRTREGLHHQRRAPGWRRCSATKQRVASKRWRR